MAGHDDSVSSEKKSSEAVNDIPTFNAENMQNNMKAVYYRWLASNGKKLVAGIHGIMGLAVIFREDALDLGKGEWTQLLLRTFMSIMGGVIAGILGFTGLNGFIFYFLVMAITSVGLIAKAGFSIHSYFDSWNQIILDGILGGLMGHICYNLHGMEEKIMLSLLAAIIDFNNLLSCGIVRRRWEDTVSAFDILYSC
ncbi:unnamed protein product [Camellia sinensis]